MRYLRHIMAGSSRRMLILVEGSLLRETIVSLDEYKCLGWL